MPGKVKVKIISGRNLPVMDRSSDTTDAYVEIKLGTTTYKTDVCRKSLHPQWNSDWYRFEVDDSELQDEPLQIRLMDHDTYSANDAIGKVYLDLNPLLLPTASLLLKYNEGNNSHDRPSNSVMSGWIPVYDTMHGIRGEVNIIVKVELFSDFNKFRQSSCGVQFFCSPTIPHGFYAQSIHGFVEELVVNDDPEYQWIDKIRTPRASNEARQTLFFKLSGELQRKIGVKALDLGGNAVIGYIQSFDLEGESGIVARGIGTAVTLVKLVDIPSTNVDNNLNDERAQSYLKFLGSAKGFFLNSDMNLCIKNILPTPIPSPSLSVRSFKADELTLKSNVSAKKMTRHLSDREFNVIIKHPSKEILHHSASLQTLLKQEDMRGTPSYGISQRFRNLKYSSQNLLSRKMFAIKSKRNDKGASSPEGIHKKKFLKYRRTQSDSTGMAEILVLSVIHATSSLDCISESPGSMKQDMEEQKTNFEASYISLPTSTCDDPSNPSSTSSESSSLDDEFDNENDDRELDTVSHIVETVRKLSMIHPSEPEHLHLRNEEKFLIVIENEGDDDLSVSDCELNTEIFDDQESSSEQNTIAISSPTSPISDNNFDFFLTQVSKHFQLKRMSSTWSLSDNTSGSLEQSVKFTSLHNIHDASSKINKYSAHEGKQTVLGDIFKRIGGKSESSTTTIMNDSKELLNVNIDCDRHRLLDLIKERKDKILKGPKELLHKLDSKIHHKKDDGSIKHHGLLETALGNVLMESVNEILATSKNDSYESKSSKESNQNISDESNSTNSVNKEKLHKTKFLSKDSLFKRPKLFLQRIDAKFHKKRTDSKMKDEGLLKTALGNVLMDSVNEVLATSHSSSQNTSNKLENEPAVINTCNNNSEIINKDVSSAPSITFERLDLENVDSNMYHMSLINNQSYLNNDLYVNNKSFSRTNSIPYFLNHITNDAFINNPHTVSLNTNNTEIDFGSNIVGINTMHACLTQTRITDTPPRDVKPEMGHQSTESFGARMSHSPSKLNSIPCIHRRSSDSDLSITPKGNSLSGSDRSGGCSSGQFSRNTIFRTTVAQENFDIMEYPFLTMSKYPAGFISYIGGAVSARSVKLLERITNIEEPESRDTWWSEIRMEIRSHARALNCNSVLGYTETTSICDDVCVLSASGTAAVIGYQYQDEASDNICSLPIIPKANNNNNNNTNNKDMMTSSLDRSDFEKAKPIHIEVINTAKAITVSGSPETESSLKPACNICHLPYLNSNISLRNITKCAVCRMGKVPEMLIATIEIPDNIPSIGRGCFVQSYVCRPLRDLKGESNAKEISDGLPFLEYELHRLLVNKLKVKSMNAVFGLKVRISVGDRMLIGIATGTAVFLSPLPPPPLPKLVSDRTTDEQQLAQLQKSLHDTVKMNKEIYQLRMTDEILNGKFPSDNDDSEDEQASLDLSMGNKDCCILEVDDPEDVDVLNSLMEPRPPDGFHVVNTEHVPGLEELEIVKNLQMFTQIWRAKIQPPYNLDKHFHRLLQSVYFKLRRMIPCALCDLQFRVDSPEPDEIQLCVLGMALGLGDPQRNVKAKRKTVIPKRNDEELIFNLEEDQIPEHSAVQTPSSNYLHAQTLKHRQKSPIRNRLLIRQRHVPYRERHGVDITPLSYVPGGKIEKYLGNLNFFFIRETTSIREEGGLSGFVHSFMTEILAIVRAHVTALGGNAMVAYFITECVLNHNLHKNQGQCLINVGGDVVYVTYYSEDH